MENHIIMMAILPAISAVGMIPVHPHAAARSDRSSRAVPSPEPNPLEDATWVHQRVDAPRRGKLEVENRREREQTERKGSDPWRNQDIDEPIPRSSAAEVEPLPIEPEGHEMDDRTEQQGDREEPEAGGARDRHAVGRCRVGSGADLDRCHVRSLVRARDRASCRRPSD